MSEFDRLESTGSDPERADARRPSFAHESEAELGRILDFYGVRWEYEPHTYPILWDLEGGVLESFSPDFYLPDLDSYIELTTLKQRLVRKKNRKLRRLRELYPDIKIKLFYARDFRMLMLKYGKVALVDALSGTLGQVVPPGREFLPNEEPRVPAVAPIDDPDDDLATGGRRTGAAIGQPAQIADALPAGSGPVAAARAESGRRRRRATLVAGDTAAVRPDTHSNA